MKRPVIVLLVFAVLAASGMMAFHWLFVAPNVPGFMADSTLRAPAQYQQLSFEFLAQRPFDGGKMWITTFAKEGYHVFLYDMDKRQILGELKNAGPVLFNADQSKVLCLQRTPADTNQFRVRIRQLLAGFSSGRLGGHAGEEPELFWMVDLKSGSAEKLGRLYQWHGSGSSFHPSPDYHYAYNRPTSGMNHPEIFVCDLQSGEFKAHLLSGYPVGWWDDSSILTKATNGDFVLYDVATKATASLITVSQLQSFFNKSGLGTNSPSSANAFCMASGKTNVFYLSQGNSRWSAARSYLIKIEHPSGSLKLIDRDFKYEWSDHFDESQNLYLYSGRESGYTNSAVYLRDLRTQETRALVKPYSGKEFSIPRFYRDEVVYVRSNMLWEVKLDGSGNRRLFPPEE